MSDGDFAEVVAAVRGRIDPDDAERERLRAVVAELTGRAEAAVADLPVDADVVHVGSTARDTWISGDRDVDLFVRFPPDLPREDLEAYGLQVGRAVLPDGREEYAEHPYVSGEHDGFDVDLVPCYGVDDASQVQSAVDRTPFHDRYLRERLTDDLAGEVRLFKQFLAGVGAYGSDLRTRGFSGYLAELLVLHYGSFRETLAAAADWQPPIRIDSEGHGEATFADPLVVVDPTDPERNVAAVCSATNVARLQHHARAFLAGPTEERFFPDEPEALSPAAVREHVDARGTTPVAVRFDAPDVVDDQLYPQLRRSLSGVTDELDRRGFDVLRADAWAGESAVLFVELAVAERPRVERHEGPPVHVREHAAAFYRAYADAGDREPGLDSRSDRTGWRPGPPYGPFVDDDRYVVERERAFASAVEFLESDEIFDVAQGARVADALEGDYEVLAGGDVAELTDEFGVELARYFDPRP